jgi:hypothetical protein
VFNGGGWLAQALDSVLGQTYADFELIAVDDGSTDGSGERLEAYARDDTRVRVLHNDRNRGLVFSLNRALAEARGRCCARMDADDICLPDRFAHQVAFLEAHPDIAAVGSWKDNFDDTHGSLDVRRYPITPGLVRWTLFFDCPLCHPSVMARTDALRAAGGYHADAFPAEDYDLWLRLVAAGHRLANLPEVLLRYRRAATSITVTQRPAGRARIATARAAALGSLLGADVAPDLALGLSRPQTLPPLQKLAVARLLHRLYGRVCRLPEVTDADRAGIRREAGSRLYSLARPHLRSLTGWRILLHACAVDPSLPWGVLSRSR